MHRQVGRILFFILSQSVLTTWAIVEDGESDALAEARHVFLREHQRKVPEEKVAEHAGEDAAVEAVVLAGRVGGAVYELPLLRIRHGALLLVHVLVPQIVQYVLQVVHAATAPAVVELDALRLHVRHSTNPVHVDLVDGKEDLVQGENVLAWDNVETIK